jgi:Fe2+ transport system protein B
MVNDPNTRQNEVATVVVLHGAIRHDLRSSWFLRCARFEAVPALLAGFLRKDLAVGMLVPLALTTAQLTIAVTVLALYFPCVATFAVLLKELGARDMLKW